jgi:hypothetical protein
MDLDPDIERQARADLELIGEAIYGIEPDYESFLRKALSRLNFCVGHLIGTASRLKQEVEAVRALKPATEEANALRCRALDAEHGAWLAGENANAWARERDDLRDEVERLQKLVADQALTIGTLKDELETERQRLAACGVAALGYFEDCIDAYKSASLSDVLNRQILRDVLRAPAEDESESES